MSRQKFTEESVIILRDSIKLRCSRCNKNFYWTDCNYPNYCPVCGGKMIRKTNCSLPDIGEESEMSHWEFVENHGRYFVRARCSTCGEEQVLRKSNLSKAIQCHNCNSMNLYRRDE